jgi:hypothetical protein
MDDFTPGEFIEVEDYTLNDGELTTLIVQPGFVEGIVPGQREFATIPEAFRFIFRNNKEYGIVSLNGVPVRFSYTEDLPEMAEPLTELLNAIIRGSDNETECSFVAENFDLRWKVTASADGGLVIRQECQRISGNYAQVLNELGVVSISREVFLGEWKILVAQLCEAFERSEVSLSEARDLELIAKLKLLDKTITGKGVLYNY